METCSAADSMRALGVLVRDSRISQYFHFELPDRASVQLIDLSSALNLKSLHELVPRITLTPSAAPLEKGALPMLLDRVRCLPLEVHVEWRLEAEGLRGTATLVRSDARSDWTLQNLEIIER